MLIISNISSGAENEESMATNLVIGDALKIKMKKMIIIRKQKDMNVKIIFFKRSVLSLQAEGAYE